MTIYQARRGRGRIVLVVTVLVAAGAVWAARHTISTTQALNGDTKKFGLVFTLGALLVAGQILLAHLEPARRVTGRRRRQLDRMHVAVLIPAYNEDPDLLARCLHSLAGQTRKPDHIVVVDDGSDKSDYSRVRRWAAAESARTGLPLTWIRTPNRGKRHAQAEGIKVTPEADVYLTVDSDAILDPNALEQGMLPFCDPRVTAVAGIVLAANQCTNILARFTDLWFVTSQLVDRSSLSAMGSVLVNSGPLALYRAEIVRDNLDSYLNETFCGKPVAFSDDSMLTLFARIEGRTVQQPTAFVFSAMPTTVSHHLRQYVRWMRGSTIRSLWRFRHLPLNSAAYWLHAARWVQMALSTALFVAIIIIQPMIDGTLFFGMLAVTIAIGYAQCLRYLTVRRADESLPSQIYTWTLAPLAALWAYFLLRPVRWYAMATCRRTGWGTRTEGVEVTLGAAS